MRRLQKSGGGKCEEQYEQNYLERRMACYRKKINGEVLRDCLKEAFNNSQIELLRCRGLHGCALVPFYFENFCSDIDPSVPDTDYLPRRSPSLFCQIKEFKNCDLCKKWFNYRPEAQNFCDEHVRPVADAVSFQQVTGCAESNLNSIDIDSSVGASQL